MTGVVKDRDQKRGRDSERGCDRREVVIEESVDARRHNCKDEPDFEGVKAKLIGYSAKY